MTPTHTEQHKDPKQQTQNLTGSPADTHTLTTGQRTLTMEEQEKLETQQQQQHTQDSTDTEMITSQTEQDKCKSNLQSAATEQKPSQDKTGATPPAKKRSQTTKPGFALAYHQSGKHTASPLFTDSENTGQQHALDRAQLQALDTPTLQSMFETETRTLQETMSSANQQKIKAMQQHLAGMAVIPMLAEEAGNPTFATAQGWKTYSTKIHTVMIGKYYPCKVDPNDSTEESARAVLQSLHAIFKTETHPASITTLNLRAKQYLHARLWFPPHLQSTVKKNEEQWTKIITHIESMKFMAKLLEQVSELKSLEIDTLTPQQEH